MTQDLGFSKGLAGVIADTTSVSQVQGEVGKLIYRGISIEEFAEKSNFEETAYFLLHGELPNAYQLKAFDTELRTTRALPKYVETIIDVAPRTAHPMQTLQTAISAIGFEEPAVDLKNVKQNLHTSVKLVSQIATAVAYISRDRRGVARILPRLDLSHAENFLYMLSGEVPSKELSRMLEVALILHVDHDFNASTFAGRVVGSTEAKLSSSISAAIGALSGPLHGGANEKVLQMADSIGSANKAKAWVLNALSTKAKVPGFGHRVYKTMDPRAQVLRAMLEKLVAKTNNRETFETLLVLHDTMIEELSKKEKDYIWPNVDFWSGALYRLMGIESVDFTPIFAVARSVGWCSHILEMWTDNRIYRPAAKYVGPTTEKITDIRSRG